MPGTAGKKPAPRRTTGAGAPGRSRNAKKAGAKRAGAKKATTKATPNKAAKKKAPSKAATKKPAAKRPAAKKTTGRGRPVKKTAVKKTRAKKTAVKKTAVKKTAVRKTAVKKTAVKATPKVAVKKAPPAKAAPKQATPTKSAPTKAAPPKPPPMAAPPTGIGRKSANKKTVICSLSGFEVTPGPANLGAKTLDRLRQKLIGEKQRLRHQADDLSAEAEALAREREAGDTQFDEESGEGDTVNIERERDLLLSATVRQVMQEIDDALERIKRNKYGVCKPAGRKITLERLEAIPWAQVCVDCKARAERRR